MSVFNSVRLFKCKDSLVKALDSDITKVADGLNPRPKWKIEVHRFDALEKTADLTVYTDSMYIAKWCSNQGLDTRYSSFGDETSEYDDIEELQELAEQIAIGAAPISAAMNLFRLEDTNTKIQLLLVKPLSETPHIFHTNHHEHLIVLSGTGVIYIGSQTPYPKPNSHVPMDESTIVPGSHVCINAGTSYKIRNPLDGPPLMISVTQIGGDYEGADGTVQISNP